MTQQQALGIQRPEIDQQVNQQNAVQHKTIVEALSANDIDGARDLLLDQIKLKVGQKSSWDSPQYRGDKGVQKSVELDYTRDSKLTFLDSRLCAIVIF